MPLAENLMLAKIVIVSKWFEYEKVIFAKGEKTYGLRFLC